MIYKIWYKQLVSLALSLKKLIIDLPVKLAFSLISEPFVSLCPLKFSCLSHLVSVDHILVKGSYGHFIFLTQFFISNLPTKEIPIPFFTTLIQTQEIFSIIYIPGTFSRFEMNCHHRKEDQPSTELKDWICRHGAYLQFYKHEIPMLPFNLLSI